MRFLTLLFLFSLNTNAFSRNPLNTITFNLQCTKNNWQFRLNKILDQIVRINPDIISLQELCVSEDEDMISFIKDGLLKRRYSLKAIATKFTHPAWDKYKEYIAIFSKKKFKKSIKGFLPESPLQRSYVGVLLNDIWYVNTHLEHKLDYAKYRYQQINYLIKKFENKNHIIMGDFNSEPGSKEQRPFDNSGYLEFFSGPTRPSHRPEKAIDGFWISPKLKNKISGFKTTRLFQRKVGGMYLSDHLGVYFFNNRAYSF